MQKIYIKDKMIGKKEIAIYRWHNCVLEGIILKTNNNLVELII